MAAKWLRWRWILRIKMIGLLRKLAFLEDIFYVGSSEALPPPLTSDEEIFLITRLEHGDQTVKGS